MSSEKKHTPGPWFLQDETDDYTNIVRPSSNAGSIICYTPQSTAPEFRANARLIAAAPDMIEALESIERLKALIEYPREVSEAHVGEAMAVSAALRKVSQAISKSKVL